jgi:hypothetical protein
MLEPILAFAGPDKRRCRGVLFFNRPIPERLQPVVEPVRGDRSADGARERFGAALLVYVWTVSVAFRARASLISWRMMSAKGFSVNGTPGGTMTVWRKATSYAWRFRLPSVSFASPSGSFAYWSATIANVGTVETGPVDGFAASAARVAARTNVPARIALRRSSANERTSTFRLLQA